MQGDPRGNACKERGTHTRRLRPLLVRVLAVEEGEIYARDAGEQVEEQVDDEGALRRLLARAIGSGRGIAGILPQSRVASAVARVRCGSAEGVRAIPKPGEAS